MSEEYEREQEGQSAEETSNDLLKNMKAELDRKQDNMSAQIDKMSSTQELLLSQLTAATSKPEQTSSDLENLMYTDPKAAVEQITASVEARVEKRMDAKLNATQQQSSTISELVSAFPELNDSNHTLTKAAIAIYEKMDDTLRKNPASYKSAVYQAAVEEGFKPISKRKKSQHDDFTFGGTNGGSSKSRADNDQSVDNSVLATAEAFGIDIKDKATKERLKKHASRNFFKYK